VSSPLRTPSPSPDLVGCPSPPDLHIASQHQINAITTTAQCFPTLRLGGTNAGIVDDLAGVGALARRHAWWFHVDGAYGGAGIFARSVRGKFAGIEQADSFIVDPHKWLFTPFDSCALIYREPERARRTHTQDASYLDVIHGADGEWNPTDYAYQLTRRARGLPLWFSLAVHGVDAYRDAIEVALRLAQETAELIEITPTWS
jgi:aromatic-L-amino-acid/L-tryptophan decarboxylase